MSRKSQAEAQRRYRATAAGREANRRGAATYRATPLGHAKNLANARKQTARKKQAKTEAIAAITAANRPCHPVLRNGYVVYLASTPDGAVNFGTTLIGTGNITFGLPEPIGSRAMDTKL